MITSDVIAKRLRTPMLESSRGTNVSALERKDENDGEFPNLHNRVRSRRIEVCIAAAEGQLRSRAECRRRDGRVGRVDPRVHGLFQRVHASSLTEAEIQTLLLTNAVTNGCESAVAFHSALALRQGVTTEDVDAMRDGRSPRDARLGALSNLARTLIERRGHLVDTERQRFVDAGFHDEQVLKVIAVVAASTITNYTANIAQPPLEAAFDAHAWRLAR